MPAAAVIPAPIAYIKVVAVKKLVVEFLVFTRHLVLSGYHPLENYSVLKCVGNRDQVFYLE